MKETIYKCNVCEEWQPECKLIGMKFGDDNALEELGKESSDIHICEVCLSSIDTFIKSR